MDKLESIRLFTETEAWGLFRAAAIGEAFGWTVLITGITIQHYHLPGYSFAVPVAGQIHGILFLIYFGILIAVYSSLRWPRKRFLAAVLVGIIPIGTLVFEQWLARKHHRKSRQIYFCSLVLANIPELQ